MADTRKKIKLTCEAYQNSAGAITELKKIRVAESPCDQDGGTSVPDPLEIIEIGSKQGSSLVVDQERRAWLLAGGAKDGVKKLQVRINNIQERAHLKGNLLPGLSWNAFCQQLFVQWFQDPPKQTKSSKSSLAIKDQEHAPPEMSSQAIASSENVQTEAAGDESDSSSSSSSSSSSASPCQVTRPLCK